MARIAPTSPLRGNRWRIVWSGVKYGDVLEPADIIGETIQRFSITSSAGSFLVKTGTRTADSSRGQYELKAGKFFCAASASFAGEAEVVLTFEAA